MPSGDKNVCNVYISTRQGVLLNLRSNIMRHFPNRNRISMHKVVFLFHTCQTALWVNHHTGLLQSSDRAVGSLWMVCVCACVTCVEECAFVFPRCHEEDLPNLSFIYGSGQIQVVIPLKPVNG